jgi:thioredoxin reductase (NADPH)
VNAFQRFAEEFAIYGYPVLFFGVLLENAGIPVPGETAVLVAGFLASPAGGGHFQIVWVIGLTVLAAVFGDNMGFWLGHRWARPRIQRGQRFLFLTPKALALAEGYFQRYGTWTIFFARFITGLRVVGALAAGTAGMSWPHFLVANAGGAFAWAVTMSLLGYFFGHSWELLHKWLGRGGFILLGCVIVLVGLPYLWRRLRQFPSGFWDRLARAQVWHGILVAVLEVICIAVLIRLAKGDRATRTDEWVAERVAEWATSAPLLGHLALAGRVLGTLPVVIGVALLAGSLLWRRGRDWREIGGLVWTLLASEGVGLLLLLLLRRLDAEPARAFALPLFGFPGLVPLRALAVFGMAGRLAARPRPQWAGLAYGMAALGTLLAGYSVLWLAEQKFTEVLLEYAAGGVILFAGIWWLEGYGPGLRALPGAPSGHPPVADHAGDVAPPGSPRADPVRCPTPGAPYNSSDPSPQAGVARSVEYARSARMAEKVVIIGSGPAGWTAAIYAARANLKPLVLEGALTEENRLKGTLPLGQLNLTTEVENYPGTPAGDSREYLRTALPTDRQPYWVVENLAQPSHGINGPELMELMRQQALNFGTRIVTDDIVGVDLQRHPFVLTPLDGQPVESLAVIIATGARANYLGLPSEERYKNRGVSACAVCDGALPRFRDKPLVVVGGGDSAVEESTYLSKYASQVYLVHRRDQLRASKIMQQRVFDNPKISPRWNRTLVEVLGNEREGVTGARLHSTVEDQTEEVACGGVFLAIGHTPNTDFLKGQVDLDPAGYVRWTTPQRTYTSVEGVFAAGDVADSYYRQAVTAAGTGCMAALDSERWLASRGWL